MKLEVKRGFADLGARGVEQARGAAARLSPPRARATRITWPLRPLALRAREASRWRATSFARGRRRGRTRADRARSRRDASEERVGEVADARAELAELAGKVERAGVGSRRELAGLREGRGEAAQPQRSAAPSIASLSRLRSRYADLSPPDRGVRGARAKAETAESLEAERACARQPKSTRRRCRSTITRLNASASRACGARSGRLAVELETRRECDREARTALGPSRRELAGGRGRARWADAEERARAARRGRA